MTRAFPGALSDRKGLNELMAACRAGAVDVIVVAKLDRFSRSMRHLVNALGELDDLGVDFVSVSEALDSSTLTGQMMRSLLGTFAEFERGRIRERMMESLRDLVVSGFWPGGPPPYGYRLAPDPAGSKHKKLVICEDEQRLLRHVYDLIVKDGHSTYSAAGLINAAGYRTRGVKRKDPAQSGSPSLATPEPVLATPTTPPRRHLDLQPK